MKKIGFISVCLFFSFSVFSFFSCSNSIDSVNPAFFMEKQVNKHQSESTHKITGKISYSGAVPSSFNEQNSQSRTIVASKPASVFYKVSAVSNGGPEITAEVSTSTEGGTEIVTYEITLSDGTYKFMATGYSDENCTIPVLFGSMDVTVPVSTANQNIVVKPIVETGATGNLNLTFRRESNKSVFKIAAKDVSGEIDCSETFNASEKAFITASDIPSGLYQVVFTVYDKDDNILYAFSEAVYIFKNLTTDTWKKSIAQSGFINEGVEEQIITQDMILSFCNMFFVSQAIGDDNNTGSYLKPYKTFAKALSRITALNNSTEQFGIYLMSDITASSTADCMEKRGSTYYLIYLNLNSYLNLKIASFGGSGAPYKLNANNLENTCVMYVGDYVKLTLANIEICGGNNSNSNGGGLYVPYPLELDDEDYDYSSKVFIDSGTIISNNTAVCGGGIFANSAGIEVVGKNVVISSNSALGTDIDNGGGGVYLRNSSFICKPNSSIQITLNTAKKNGGGFFAKKHSHITLDNALVNENAASMDSSGNYMGGGIYATYDNKRDINNSVTITNSSFYENTATFGAAVCMYGLTDLVIGGSAADGGKVDFYNNTARSNGGAINIIDVSVTNNDSSITWLENSLTLYYNVNIYNNTIQESSALGSGIYCESEVFLFGTTKVVTGNDFYYNWTDKESLPAKVLKPIQLKDNIAVNNQAFFKITLPQEFYNESTQLLELNGYNSDNTKLISITPQTTGSGTVSWFIDSEGKLKKDSAETLYTDPDVVGTVPSPGDEIKLTAPNDLKYISTLTAAGNDLEGVYFEITGDLTAAADYVPIGNTSDKPFKGIINGKGHYIKITNFVKENDEHYAGLVRYNGGIIENIVIALEGYEDTTSNFYNCVVPNIWCGSAGLICQENLPNGIIRNCWNRTNLTTIGCPHGFGGLAALIKAK